jgi:hypothetical protein
MLVKGFLKELFILKTKVNPLRLAPSLNFQQRINSPLRGSRIALSKNIVPILAICGFFCVGVCPRLQKQSDKPPVGNSLRDATAPVRMLEPLSHLEWGESHVLGINFRAEAHH